MESKSYEDRGLSKQQMTHLMKDAAIEQKLGGSGAIKTEESVHKELINTCTDSQMPPELEDVDMEEFRYE